MTDDNLEYNAGDPQDVGEARRKAKVRETRLEAQTAVVMGTAEGRAWVWDLLSQCGAYHTPFRSDSHITAFNCGKQDIGHSIMARIMKECPEKYVVMQKEQENG